MKSINFCLFLITGRPQLHGKHKSSICACISGCISVQRILSNGIKHKIYVTGHWLEKQLNKAMIQVLAKYYIYHLFKQYCRVCNRTEGQYFSQTHHLLGAESLRNYLPLSQSRCFTFIVMPEGSLMLCIPVYIQDD